MVWSRREDVRLLASDSRLLTPNSPDRKSKIENCSMSEPIIMDGTIVAEATLEKVRTETLELIAGRGITPGLAVVLVGDDPASATYVRSKGKACERLGFHSVTHRLPPETSEEHLIGMITD